MIGRHGIAVVAALTALVTATTAATAAERRPAATDPTCALDAKLVPTCPGQALFGAWVKGYDKARFDKQISAAEDRYLRPIDVVHVYHAPIEKNPSPMPFDTDPAHNDPYGLAERTYALKGNRIVFVNFKPGLDFTEVADGAHDDVIRAAAHNIRSVAPHKVMLALFHEPENDVSHGGECTSFKPQTPPGNTPELYRAMWRHTRAIFDAEGATNVVWVMNYMHYDKWDCMVRDLWPGNDLVDWIAYDPYSSDGTVSTVTRFADVLAAKTDADHRFTDKPYLLAEYGIRSCKPAETHAYYDNLRRLLAAGTVPNLRGLVVFDSKGSGEGAVDYRVGYTCDSEADPAEQASFNRLAADRRLFPPIVN
jgi:hypothetical protein